MAPQPQQLQSNSAEPLAPQTQSNNAESSSQTPSDVSLSTSSTPSSVSQLLMSSPSFIQRKSAFVLGDYPIINEAHSPFVTSATPNVALITNPASSTRPAVAA